MKHKNNGLPKLEILLCIGGFLFLLMYYLGAQNVLVSLHSPLLIYVRNTSDEPVVSFLGQIQYQMLPLFDYADETSGEALAIQDYETEHLLASMQEEGLLEQDEKMPEQDSNRPELTDDSAMTVSENMTEQGWMTEEQKSMPDEQKSMPDEQKSMPDEQKNMEDEPERQPLSMDAYADFDTLLKDFYVVDKTTYIDEKELSLDLLLGQDMSIKKEEIQGPQILIYHTHAHEEYMTQQDSAAYTVVDAGNELATLLTENYGYQVLHDDHVYDDVRDYAYAKAAPALEQILAENPSIKVIIDLHRDGVAEGVRLSCDLDGKPAAQIMLFNGLSRTKKIGEIEYLKNENRSGNLAFSFQLEKTLMECYPQLCRKIYLKGYRYNMQYLARSLLVELGAQTNTKEEVQNAIGPLARCIHLVLSTGG